MVDETIEERYEEFLSELQDCRVQFIGAWGLENDPINWNLRSHSHGYFELLYFVNGKAGISFGKDSLPVALFNMVVYPPGVEHKEIPDFGRAIEVVCIQLHVDSRIVLPSSFHVSDEDDALLWICKRVLMEYQDRGPYFREIASSLCRSLFYLAGRSMKGGRDRPNEIVKRSLLYIHEHFSEGLSLEKLAEIAYASPSHLTRLFKKELGTSPVRYLNRVRIDVAKKLLCLKDDPINDVALKAGFEDALYFSRLFRQMTSMSPSQFRKDYAAGKGIG
jgi:AraC-like DNA-binding protein